MSEYFPKAKNFEERVKVELDSTNYGTKSGLENTTEVDTEVC